MVTQFGGKSSNTLVELTSSISRTRRYLMLQVEKMLKVKRLLSMVDTTDLTKDGELTMLTEQEKKELRVFTTAGDSISTESSTSDQDSQ
jgi:proline dehydrogenase